MVKKFMENATTLNIDLNAFNNYGFTGFHCACEYGQVNVVRIFLENAAAFNIDLNAIDNDGMTGLHKDY